MQQLLTQTESTCQQENPSSPEPADGPLFVVGAWRSGTSLLYALLNQHPRIALMYEDDLFILRSLFWLPRKSSSWLVKWDYYNGAITRHGIDPSRIPQNVSDLRTALKTVHVEYAQQKKGATIWGCKSPTYYDLLPSLARTFPNARFVVIYRDPRSICSSVVKAASTGGYFFGRRGMRLRTLLACHKLKLGCDWLVRNGFPVYQIQYEELVREQEPIMRAVCEFLRIPFDTKMVSLEGADRSAIENGDHHSLVKGNKILTSRGGSSDLPPALKGKIERYIRLWQEQSGGTWPAYPKSLDTAPARPSLAEQVCDWITYTAVRSWYFMVPVVYSFLPLPIFRMYRRLRGKSFSWLSSSTHTT
jgi:hypothetical protein